jgi:hypothetical protein
VLDFRRCDTPQLFETYQDFGVLCARRVVRCALLQTGGEAADAHYALRDTLATLARIAQIRLDLRLVLVARSAAAAAVGAAMREELRGLGCNAQVCSTAREAGQWLRAGCQSPDSNRASAACSPAYCFLMKR